MSEKHETVRAMIREEFEAYREAKEEGIRAIDNDRFVNAWAMIAYLAESRERERGHEIAKLQHRIHRQRVANRELLDRIKKG